MMTTSQQQESNRTVEILVHSSRVASGASETRHNEPICCGLPWPEGWLENPGQLRLETESGVEVPLQTSVLEYWPDRSIRWLQLDWQASGPSALRRFVLSASTTIAAVAPEQPVRTRSLAAEAGLRIETGALRCDLRLGGPFPFHSVSFNGSAGLESELSGLIGIDDSGASYAAVVQKIEILSDGPLKATVRATGQLMSQESTPLADVACCLSFFAGLPLFRMDMTVTNPRASDHPGGIWTLGMKGSIHLRALTLSSQLAGPSPVARAQCSAEAGSPLQAAHRPFEIYQEASGGEFWKSPVHVNSRGEVPMAMNGYRIRSGGHESAGKRADPIVISGDGESQIAVYLRDFWQRFPKSIAVTEDRLEVGILPGQFPDAHELQGGEQITESIFLAVGPDPVGEIPLSWCRAPGIALANPAWYARAEAVPFLTPRSTDRNSRYLELVDEALNGERSLLQKREVIDEYGWRHFGDIYADHEAVFHQSESPLVSHYNNQYDLILGFCIQLMRSGDPRWALHMQQLASHVMDIDLYHTDCDKSTYNRGQFWHTVHYIDAGRSSHRSYPEAEGVHGGGPSTGNLYTTGLLMHFLLTGSHQSKEMVQRLGRYVIDADDGRRTKFKLLDSGFTGHVSESGFDQYNGPGRSPANAINALLDAFRLSAEPEYLLKAEQLIGRCIHPRDDLAKRNLLDAENRWFYTMFLQSLGKYLDLKIERGELDKMYAYARESLLHYARWAAEHEYPYLDRPEILEFPTETWAAQDLRKSEVFKFASRHAEQAERELFLERSRFFFDSATTQLSGAATRNLARPLALLMAHGFSQSFFDQAFDTPAPPPLETGDFGRPSSFESQKSRVKKKLVRSALLLTAVGLAVLVWAFLRS